MSPKIAYNKKNSILSIRIGKAKSVDSDIHGNVVVDYDEKGSIVSIDIMSVNLNHFIPVRHMSKLAIEKG